MAEDVCGAREGFSCGEGSKLEGRVKGRRRIGVRFCVT